MRTFALNGCIGESAYGEVDFPTAESLVRHLDFLGVDRTLVYARAAVDCSPVNGNKRLLSLIEPYRERLVPSFVLTPADFYEYGTLDFLKAKAREGAVRAFGLCPGMSRFAVRQIERVAAELAAFEPVFLMDVNYCADPESMGELIALAGRFPSIRFVVTQAMWGAFGPVLDLMWRCPNVHLDTSWLHMRNALALVAEDFGTERLLFGLGSRSHFGSALGALAHAPFTPEQKELVAHGNIERLLGMKPLAAPLAQEPPLLAEKPLWNRFRKGEALPDADIWDAHGHAGATTRGWFILDGDPETYFASLARHMDGTGVRKLVLSGEEPLFADPLAGNATIERQARESPDPSRFLGYAVYNPFFADRYDRAAFDDWFSRDYYVGFKILPSYWRVNVADARYDRMWAYAHERRLPVLVHTWNDSMNAPSMLAGRAETYPDATLLLGHSGGGAPGRLEAEELALRFPNVYLETCGSFCSTRDLVTSLERVGAGRVVFGSDTGGHDQAFELANVLSLPLPDATIRPIMGDTFRAILARRR